jgi:glutamate N-acetyltransferase/amino-acid N-acetyltransferase
VKLRRRAHRVRVAGFRLAGVRAGLKMRGPDVALIVADPPATAAGVFTTNRVQAAPVQVTRRRIVAGRAAAVLVHAGNANACTGRAGVRVVEASTARVGRLLGVPPEQVLAGATGRIGFPVPSERLLAGVDAAVAALAPDGFADAAQAIMTTDAFPKTAVRRVRVGGRTATIAVLGKGCGMIAPDMATLLVFALTDARIGRTAADGALRAAVADSFNVITVDGDMSTNDTVLLLASGAVGNAAVRGGSRDHARFTRALTSALTEVARLCVLDGEGSGRLVEIVVRGARSDRDAQAIARAIGNSPLCKCAFAGGDPNWGRLLMAAGMVGVPVDADRASVTIDGVLVARRGRPLPGALPRAARRMRKREFRIELALGLGRGTGRILAADLTTAYVHFNAAYTT